MLEHPAIAEGHDIIKTECCSQLAGIYHFYNNYSAASKYAKLAYEHCLRSSDHTNLSGAKEGYLKLRADFAKLPPLRFAVGDEVKFLHVLETGSEWKLGKVVELYYRERGFEIAFNAPYRIQLLDDSDGGEPPVYAWVKADLDRYVRKRGVRSIEDTRYQTRLDAKVAELAQVYRSKEFMRDVYHILVRDRDFAYMLHSVWQVTLSETVLDLYHMFVMYRQPFVPTDSGYHVPSTEEVIAEIRAFFDPAHLSGDATYSVVGEESDLQWVRNAIMGMLRNTPDYRPSSNRSIDGAGVQTHLLESIKSYFDASSELNSSISTADLLERGSNLTVPVEMSEAISKASTIAGLRLARPYCGDSVRLEQYLVAWIWLHNCLEKPDAGNAGECAFLYFLVKSCLDQGAGVPKLALAAYDRMNMQLSREFIRCANPTCELNKLDKSTGKVKFKQCSRCKTVIYCSRDCQTAHYPEHKSLCREHATG